MSGNHARAHGANSSRPPCYRCGEAFIPEQAERHTAPVKCGVCPRCTMEPACYTCRNMYCPCEIHEHG